MIHYQEQDALAHLNFCLSTPNVEDTFYGIWETVSVHYGEDGLINSEQLDQLHLPSYNIHRIGGPFVTHPGDFSYCHIVKKQDSFNHKLMQFLKKKIQLLGYKVDTNNNDLLIEGQKFLGHMCKKLTDGRYYYGGHISFNVDKKLIHKISLKEIKKEPIGLNNFNITPDMVSQWLDEFLFYEVK